MDDHWDNILVGDRNVDDSQQFFDRRREAKRMFEAADHGADQTLSSREMIAILERQRQHAAQMAPQKSSHQHEPEEQEEEEEEKENHKPAAATAVGSLASVSGGTDPELMRLVEQRLGQCDLRAGERRPTTRAAAAVAATKSQPAASKPRTAPAASAAKPAAKPGPSGGSSLASSQSSLNQHRRAGELRKTAAASQTSNPKSSAAAPASRRPNSAPPAAIPTVPSAYNYKAIYGEKLAQRQRQLAEQERKAREVRSRPMPDFQAAHRQMSAQMARRQVPATCPNTPKTLKVSAEAAERRRQRVDEYWRQKEEEKKCPKARPADVLVAAPFVPTIEHREIETKPFRLIGEQRFEELKELKERRAERQEAKRLQQLAEQEELERQQMKEVRKLTVFKANPNPFA